MTRTDRHLVVDGSNIATEGRTSPQLAQLDEAVQAITAERTYDSVTVIVDATFAHRIDESERAEFEQAVLAGEIVTPPAGAIGRGDAFILQIADRAGAVVLSNDSFQEFHGEHTWLFDEGRLVGGKPIEGIGWIFVDRSPVRGPASRRSVREAGRGSGGRRTGSRSRSRASAAASGPAPKPTNATPPPAKKGGGRRGSKKADKTSNAGKAGKAEKAAATPKRAAAATPSKRSKKSGGDGQAKVAESGNKGGSQKRFEELNDPMTFMRFVSEFSIGDEVEGVVERFSSHGCYLRANSAQCYLPSRAMGDPPPSRARDVVAHGQGVIVKVESLDSDRRGINVTLVRTIPQDGTRKSRDTPKGQGSGATANRSTSPARNARHTVGNDGSEAADSGDPTRSTANVATTMQRGKKAAKKAASKRGGKKAATATTSPRVKRATARKASAGKAASTNSAASRKAATKKAVKKAGAKKTAAKAASKKAAPKKAAPKKAAAKKAAPKKTAAKAASKKAAAKKAPAKKSAKKAAPKKAAPRKAAKKAAPKKAAPKKAAAKKATKAATKKAAPKKAAKKAAPKKTAAKKAAKKA